MISSFHNSYFFFCNYINLKSGAILQLSFKRSSCSGKKKHVFGIEVTVARKGCQTHAFVGWLFPFFSFSNLQSCYYCVVFSACVQLVYIYTSTALKVNIFTRIWVFCTPFLPNGCTIFWVFQLTQVKHSLSRDKPRSTQVVPSITQVKP